MVIGIGQYEKRLIGHTLIYCVFLQDSPNILSSLNTLILSFLNMMIVLQLMVHDQIILVSFPSFLMVKVEPHASWEALDLNHGAPRKLMNQMNISGVNGDIVGPHVQI